MIEIFIGLLIGAVLYFTKSYMGIGIAFSCFLCYLIILKIAKLKRYLTLVILGFTLVSFINCYLYFEINNPNANAKVRIIEVKGNYYIGNYKNKRIRVFTNLYKNKLELGRKYLISGSFEKKPDNSKGIIGNYYLNSYVSLKEDLIYKGYKLRDSLYNKLSLVLDEDKAGTILALSFGDSSYINYDGREKFNLLGISHIISVSGLHITLIFEVLKKLFGIKLSLLSLFLYVIFTGGKAATIRAFIMIILINMSLNVRRKYESISALSFAAFIILLIRPYSLLDSGYVLSFLSVAGIIILQNKLERYFYKLPSFIRTSLSLTVSSMVFTIPYMIFIFKRISIGGLISNFLLVPFYTALIVLGLSLFIFMKVPLIFNCLIYVISSIFIIVNEIELFLMSILPMPLEFTYIHGVMILFLYLSYLLIIRGYNSLKYLPLVFMILILKENYIIYPEINFIAGKKSDIIQVIYDNKNIMVSGEKVKLKYVYEDYGKVNKIYDEFEDELFISLDKKYFLRVKKLGNSLSLSFIYKNKEIKFISKENLDKLGDEAIEAFLSSNYDIIEVEKNGSVVNGRYYGTYKIIGGKAYFNYIN